MKKYKLIKEYPGSPSLNTEISKATIYRNKLHYKSFMIKGEDWFELVDPENYPEFWEEVIEKDYEILVLKCNTNYQLLFKDDTVYYKNNKFQGISKDNIKISFSLSQYEKNINNNSHWSIHSVKRLSDGEIFTVGDKCTSGKASGVITKIWFCDNGELRINSDGNYCMNIKGIQHCKEPLFTTEDGVDIFEGNKFYRVTKDFIFWDISAEVSKEYHYKYLSEIGIKHFSTKEKAEEYILMNKPCLSLQEVLNVLQLPLYKNHTNKKYIEELKQITNTKING